MTPAMWAHVLESMDGDCTHGYMTGQRVKLRECNDCMRCLFEVVDTAASARTWTALNAEITRLKEYEFMYKSVSK